jgi:hypothetical protein
MGDMCLYFYLFIYSFLVCSFHHKHIKEMFYFKFKLWATTKEEFVANAVAFHLCNHHQFYTHTHVSKVDKAMTTYHETYGIVDDDVNYSIKRSTMEMK